MLSNQHGDVQAMRGHTISFQAATLRSRPAGRITQRDYTGEEMAKRRYRRKSHLAAYVNSRDEGEQIVWGILVIVGFVFAMFMYFSK